MTAGLHLETRVAESLVVASARLEELDVVRLAVILAVHRREVADGQLPGAVLALETTFVKMGPLHNDLLESVYGLSATCALCAAATTATRLGHLQGSDARSYLCSPQRETKRSSQQQQSEIGFSVGKSSYTAVRSCRAALLRVRVL